MGAADLVLVGGVEHMGHHAMGDEVEFNPRFVSERLIDESAAVMGQTAENLHDAFPQLTREAADRYAAESQRRAAAAWDDPDGVMSRTVVPMSVFGDEGWRVAARDEFLRPETTVEGLATLRTPFRAGRPRHRRQLRRAHGRRHRRPARRRGVGRGARPRAGDAARRLRLHRRRAAPDGHRPRPGDRARPRPGRADDRRRRPLRAERAVRGPGADLVRRARRRPGRSAAQPATAARSPAATRSPPPACA